LRGEKIDIIEYNPDPAKFVCNGLAPAVISKVVIDQANRLMEVIVPDDQLSLAIGKRGQNVRLASKLTEWRIDVKSESKYQKSLKEGYDSLLALPGVGDATADNLYEAGFSSAEELAGGLVEELVTIPGISQQKAVKFLDAAKEYVAELEESQAEQEKTQAEQEEAQTEEEKAKAEEVESQAETEKAQGEEEEAETDKKEEGESEEDDKV